MENQTQEVVMEVESIEKVSEDIPSVSKTSDQKSKKRNRTTTLGRPSIKQGEPNVQYALR